MRLAQDSMGHSKTQSFPSGLPSRTLPASPDTEVALLTAMTALFPYLEPCRYTHSLRVVHDYNSSTQEQPKFKAALAV